MYRVPNSSSDAGRQPQEHLPPYALRELERLLGPDRVLTSSLSMAAYSYDATLLRGQPQAVVFPETTQEVAAVMQICHCNRIPVTPRGHGTGLSGGSVPVSGVVLVLTRMNRIMSIDADNRIARVQAGVVNADIQVRLDELGLMYAPDPASQKVCSLGGNAAEGAGGMRGLKYGVTRDHIAGLTVVLANGDVCHLGGLAQRALPGPDWLSLMVGSEGTLGIFTEIDLRLVPKPTALRTLLAAFNHLEDAAAAVSAIIARGIIPAALELMDQTVVSAVEDYVGGGLPVHAAAVLLIEIDGLEQELGEQTETIQELCRGQNAISIETADSGDRRQHLWLARRSAIGAIARLAPCYDLEDATVPRDRLVEMLSYVVALGNELDLMIGILAHAGDGNLHPLILFDDRDNDQVARVLEARSRIFRRALDLGGTLSGEHGIGLLKRDYMPWLFRHEELTVMEAIKISIDPQGILNPGKILTGGGDGDG